METLKKIGNKLKVILTQLISFILSFFKTDEDGGRALKKDDKNINYVNTKKATIISNNSASLPDEADTKSDNHLSYKQSISSVNSDMKEEIKNKVQAKEIYFSEIVIVNTILEVLEEKNNFKFSELSEDKKDSIKEEVEKVKDKIIPSIKKEMLSNKVKTKEELKTTISKKITNLHSYYNPIKNVLNAKEKELTEEDEPEIVIENKELNIKPIENKKKKHIITIAPIEKKVEEEELEKEKDSEDFISIKREKEKDKDKDKEKHSHKHDPEDEVYFMADILPDKKNNMNLPNVVKIDTNKDLISETKKETAEAIKIKSEKIPFMMVPNNIKNKIPAKERIKNAVIDTSLLLSTKPSIDKEEEKDLTLEEKTIKPIYKSTEEEISPEEAKIADIEVDREILENIRNDLKRQQQFNTSSKNETKEIIDNIKDMEKAHETAVDIQQEMVDEKENILEEIEKENKDIIAKLDEIEDEIIKEEKETKKETKEEITPKEEETVLPLIVETKEDTEKKDDNEIKNIRKNTEEVIINANKEIKKEDLEDKDYDEYERQIDDLLYNIEMYKIKNEDSMTPSEREKLNQEKNKLKSLKTKLEKQKDLDIEREKRELEAEITKDEIQGIQDELKQLHLEHQEEVNDDILEKLNKMEEKNDKQLAELEQQLIKSKLQKAAKAAEIPSFLALPFVRHKYFFYFTIGLFVNNHFNFLKAIFKRKNVKYEPIDLTEIKNGYDALDRALDKTYENIVYLDYLENESINKYPNLKEDEEFNKYVEKIRTKLNSNYERLQKKQKMINKYIKKVNKRNKVFKKYKLVKENKD